MQPDDYANTYNTSQNNRFSFRKVALIVLGVAILLVMAISVFSTVKPSDSKTAKDFAEFIQKKEVDKSYGMTSSSFKKVTAKEDWDLTVNRIAEFLVGKLIEQESSGNKGIYIFQPKGSKYIITIGVIEESGNRKVNYFNSSLIR